MTFMTFLLASIAFQGYLNVPLLKVCLIKHSISMNHHNLNYQNKKIKNSKIQTNEIYFSWGSFSYILPGDKFFSRENDNRDEIPSKFIDE